MRAAVRSIAAALAAAAVAGCAAAVPAAKPRPEPARSGPLEVARPVPLGNPGFESPPAAGDRCPERWECTTHSDPGAFRFAVAPEATEGRSGLCIERVRNEPWGLATQSVPAASLRGARLRFSVAVRVERAEGAGTGPWAVVHGPHGNLAHEQRLVAAPGGWQRLAVEFPVAPDAQMVEVGVTMEGGGRACFDDARLEILPR